MPSASLLIYASQSPRPAISLGSRNPTPSHSLLTAQPFYIGSLIAATHILLERKDASSVFSRSTTIPFTQSRRTLPQKLGIQSQTMNPDLKSELLAAANASLRRHFARLDDEVKTTAAATPPPSEETLADFTAHLQRSRRILGLFGAGLSASSGVPTYRGADGFWGKYSDQQLATVGAFKSDPSLVWQFYDERRKAVFAAKPNAAHFALAKLAAVVPGFLTVNQNVDGMYLSLISAFVFFFLLFLFTFFFFSGVFGKRLLMRQLELCKRSGHPTDQIMNFHGSLFRDRCVNNECGFEVENWETPAVPASARLSQPSPPEPDAEMQAVTIKEIPITELPHCPKCKNELLRPAVVWFGESIPEDQAKRVENWFNEGEGKVDLMLVVGTSAIVYPAAGYITEARKRGARIAWFNMEVKTAGTARPEEGDWSFVGDAATLVPLALSSFLEAHTSA